MESKRKCLGISLLSGFVIFSALNCNKTIIEHPFTDITTLDCRNLIIRSVTLKDSIIEVALENTCKNCEDNWVYLDMTMLKRSNLIDTLAQSECCMGLGVPKNGQTGSYKLFTKLTSLPDLKSVQFNFGYLCNDVTYIPK